MSTDTRTRPTGSRNSGKGRTAEERAAEVDALAEQLTTAVAELTTSDAWVAGLRVEARFTRYSPRTCCCCGCRPSSAALRCPGWRGIGRGRRWAARSSRAPARSRCSPRCAAACPRRKPSTAATGQPAYDGEGRPAVVVRGFRLERVFRYEDTGGEPLPEVPDVGYVNGDTPASAWDALAALVAGAGYRLTADPEPGDARGHTDYTARLVNIDPGYPFADRVHTLVHELGHLRAGHATRRDISRAQRETEVGPTAIRTRSAPRRPRSTTPPGHCSPTSRRRAPTSPGGRSLRWVISAARRIDPWLPHMSPHFGPRGAGSPRPQLRHRRPLGTVRIRRLGVRIPSGAQHQEPPPPATTLDELGGSASAHPNDGPHIVCIAAVVGAAPTVGHDEQKSRCRVAAPAQGGGVGAAGGARAGPGLRSEPGAIDHHPR